MTRPRRPGSMVHGSLSMTSNPSFPGLKNFPAHHELIALRPSQPTLDQTDSWLFPPLWFWLYA